MKWMLLISFFYIFFPAFSQNELPSPKNKWQPDILLVDARRSFVDKQRVKIGGVRAGVEYNRVHRFGLGYYFLIDRVFNTDFPYKIPTNRVEYNLSYFALYYERVFYYNNKWELLLNSSIGGGKIKAYYNPLGYNDRVLVDKMEINPIELSVGAKYEILNWLAVGGGMGYRFATGATPSIRRDFTRPIYIFKIDIRFLRIAQQYFES